MLPQRPAYLAGAEDKRRIPISRGIEAQREQPYGLNRYFPRRLANPYSFNAPPTSPPRSVHRNHANVDFPAPSTAKFDTTDDFEERHKAIDAVLRQNLTCKDLPRDRQDWGWYKVKTACHLSDRQLMLLQDLVVHQAALRGPSEETQAAQPVADTSGYLDGYISSLRRPRGPGRHQQQRYPCWTPSDLQGASMDTAYWENKWDDADM